MGAGQIYASACSACHLGGGWGQPGVFPPLPSSAVGQQTDPFGLVRIILGGVRTGLTSIRPSRFTMPSFAWKLPDRKAADVATYVCNAADTVDAGNAKKVRNAGDFAQELAERAES